MKNYFLLFLLVSIIIYPQKKNKKANVILPDLSCEIISKIEIHSEINAPLIFENNIFVPIKTGLISCYGISGDLRWKHQLQSSVSSKPIADRNILLVAANNQELISLNINDGSQIQSIGISDSITADLKVFEYTGDKELMIPKTGNSKAAVILGFNSGEIVCYDLETLQEYWRNRNAKGSIKIQEVAGNKILFTSTDGYLYCIDSRNGLLIWRWKEKADSGFSNSKIAIEGKSVYMVDEENYIICIDILIGYMKWKSNFKAFSPIGISTDKKKLFTKGMDKKFYILASTSGKVIKEVKRSNKFSDGSTSTFEFKKNIIYSEQNSLFSLNTKFVETKIASFENFTIMNINKLGTNKFLLTDFRGSLLLVSLN